jgi:hypothetical protein
MINPIHLSTYISISDCSPLCPDDAPPIPSPILPSVNLEAGILNTASVTTLPSNSSELGPLGLYTQEVEELVAVCQDFLDQVQRGGAPWVVQQLNRLNHINGPMPTDPAHFSYWMAMVGGPLNAHWRVPLINMTAGSTNRRDGKG